MANLRLNPTDIIGTLIPDAYVDNVILETRGDIIKDRNPHIDFVGEEGRRDPQTGRILEPRGAPDTEGFLAITVDLLLKDKIEEGGISGWLEQEGFAEYLKVAVVVSTSEMISNVLSNESIPVLFQRGEVNIQAFLGTFLAREEYLNLSVPASIAYAEKHFYSHTFFASRTFDGSNPGAWRNAVEVQKDRDGNRIRNTSIRARFSTPRENPEHVTVYAFTYLDLQTLQDDYGGLDFGDINEVQFATGRTVIQPVILNSQIVRNAFLYRDPEGNVWGGPVHQMGPSQWMGGRFHSEANPGPHLTRTVMPNTTVQDLRNVLNIDKHVVDLSFFESRTFPVFDRIFRERIKDNLGDADKSSYFSDLFLARGLDDQANMAFSFNAGKFIKERTKYPILAEKRPELISTSYKIVSFKIIRRRIKKPLKFKESIVGLEVDKKDILAFDKNEAVFTVVQNQEIQPGVLPAVIGQDNGNSMRELKITADESIRTFSISDRDMVDITDGYYQYGVEIEIQDKLQTFLVRRLSVLLENRKRLFEYFVKAAQPTGRFKDAGIAMKDPHVMLDTPRADLGRIDQRGNYNPSTNRFTQKFIEEINNSYEGLAEAPWNKAVANLSEVLDLFTSSGGQETGFKATGWGRDLWTICSPQTGTPDGILAVLKLIDNVAQKISQLIGVRVSTTTDSSPDGTPRNSLNGVSTGLSSGEPKKDVYKISYYFTNAVFDSNELKKTGYQYLLDNNENMETARGNRSLAGLRVLLEGNYRDRVSSETLRYFREEGQNLAHMPVIGSPLTYLGDTTTSDYRYFAPSRIRINQGNTVSLFHNPPAQKFAAMASDIANIKSPPNQPKKIPSPRGRLNSRPRQGRGRSDAFSRVIGDNLVEVLADKNCTIELPVLIPSGITQNVITRTAEDVGDSPKGQPPLSDVVIKSDRIEGADGENIAMGAYLGDSSGALNQLRENLERIIDIHTTRDEDVFNPGLAFLKILFNFIVEDENLTRKTGNLTQGELNDKFTMKNFVLSNPNNAIERGRRPLRGEDARVKVYSEFIPGLPNQIKALFLASDMDGSGVIREGLRPHEDLNVLSDPIKSIPIFLRFMNLVKVEILTGYRTVTQRTRVPTITDAGVSNRQFETLNTRTKTEIQLKEPLWEEMTREIFQGFVDDGKEMLCRLTPYINKRMSIEPLKGLQLPIYDSYFVIRSHLFVAPPLGLPEQAPQTDVAPQREEAPGREQLRRQGERTEVRVIRDLINLERAYRDISREYISTDPMLFEVEAAKRVEGPAKTKVQEAKAQQTKALGLGEKIDGYN